MPRPNALFVDDEDSAPAARFQRAIEGAGFEVVRAFGANEATTALHDFAPRFVDLIVLDRELPETVGGKPENAVGDALFREVASRYPDVPIIVLTGHSDESSVKLALDRINIIDLGAGDLFQQVQHFGKIDNFAFEAAVQRVADAYQATEGVAVEGFEGDLASRRVLKRVAQYFGGAVIRVAPASGLSGSSVWVCKVIGPDGRHRASVVVKVVADGQLPPAGGFMAAVPRRHTAQPTLAIRGGCAGRVGHVAPLAGIGPISLMEQLTIDEAAAAVTLERVASILETVTSACSMSRLDDFMTPLLSWEEAQAIAASHSIVLPEAGMHIQTRVGCLHGDLHPENVVIDDGEPVFIDFDRQQDGCLLIDLLFLVLGAVFHRDGALRTDPPDQSQLLAMIEGRGAGPGWLGVGAAASGKRDFGERERWAAGLGYVLRQLRYADVRRDRSIAALAVGVAHHASRVLAES